MTITNDGSLALRGTWPFSNAGAKVQKYFVFANGNRIVKRCLEGRELFLGSLLVSCPLKEQALP